jgi:hypothetical protein
MGVRERVVEHLYCISSVSVLELRTGQRLLDKQQSSTGLSLKRPSFVVIPAKPCSLSVPLFGVVLRCLNPGRRVQLLPCFQPRDSGRYVTGIGRDRGNRIIG